MEPKKKTICAAAAAAVLGFAVAGLLFAGYGLYRDHQSLLRWAQLVQTERAIMQGAGKWPNAGAQPQQPKAAVTTTTQPPAKPAR
jgi:hypothetical protein